MTKIIGTLNLYSNLTLVILITNVLNLETINLCFKSNFSCKEGVTFIFNYIFIRLALVEGDDEKTID